MWHFIWNSPLPPPCIKYNYYCCASRKYVFKLVISSNSVGCGCFSGACALWPTAWQETHNTVWLCISCSYIFPSLFLCSVTLSDLNLYSVIFSKLTWWNLRGVLIIWGHSCCFSHCLHCLVYMLLRQLSNSVSGGVRNFKDYKEGSLTKHGRTNTYTLTHTRLNLPTSFLLFFCHSFNLLSHFALFVKILLATFSPKVPGTFSSWN